MHRGNYSSGGSNYIKDRLRGNFVLGTDYNNGQSGGSNYERLDSNAGVVNRVASSVDLSSSMYWAWRRAPGFFDMVTYTGNDTAGRTVSHSLGVAPEMMWIKCRSAAFAWTVYHSGIGHGKSLYLSDDSAESGNIYSFNNTAPSSTVITLGQDDKTNGSSSRTYVAYLFATLAGISKVGTFSHTNGSSTDVDCGFSSGSMMVIVKRTDAAGDWYQWDSVRGIVSGNDPYVLLNTNAAQNSSNDYIDTLSSGFQIASGFTTGSYVFYAIAA